MINFDFEVNINRDNVQKCMFQKCMFILGNFISKLFCYSCQYGTTTQQIRICVIQSCRQTISSLRFLEECTIV